MRWKIHGPADGASRAVASTGIHQEEFARFSSEGVVLLEKPEDVCRLDLGGD